MEKYGKVFKIFRESKGLTLKEVAGDYITPAQLSRFENGKSNLSVDTFFNCLRRMNVLQGEFLTFYNSYFGEENITFSLELIEAGEHGNSQFFKQKITDYKEMLTREYRKSDRALLAVFYVLLNRCDSTQLIPEEEKEIIVDYLMAIEDWCYYELWILGHCSRVFNSNSLELLGNELIKRTTFYEGIPENKRRICRVLLNITGQLIDREEELMAARFIRIIDSLKILESNLFERLQLKFFKAQLKFLQGQATGLEEMKKCQDLAEFLGCYNAVEQIKSAISQITDM